MTPSRHLGHVSIKMTPSRHVGHVSIITVKYVTFRDGVLSCKVTIVFQTWRLKGTPK